MLRQGGSEGGGLSATATEAGSRARRACTAAACLSLRSPRRAHLSYQGFLLAQQAAEGRGRRGSSVGFLRVHVPGAHSAPLLPARQRRLARGAALLWAHRRSHSGRGWRRCYPRAWACKHSRRRPTPSCRRSIACSICTRLPRWRTKGGRPGRQAGGLDRRPGGGCQNNNNMQDAGGPPHCPLAGGLTRCGRGRGRRGPSSRATTCAGSTCARCKGRRAAVGSGECGSCMCRSRGLRRWRLARMVAPATLRPCCRRACPPFSRPPASPQVVAGPAVGAGGPAPRLGLELARGVGRPARGRRRRRAGGKWRSAAPRKARPRCLDSGLVRGGRSDRAMHIVAQGHQARGRGMQGGVGHRWVSGQTPERGRRRSAGGHARRRRRPSASPRTHWQSASTSSTTAAAQAREALIVWGGSRGCSRGRLQVR